MKSTWLIAGIFAVGFVVPACAEFGDCDDKRSALSDFGLVGLADSGDKFPKGIKRLPDCHLYKGKYAECELLDQAGVSYLIGGNVVVRKDILIHRSGRPPLLPFGLKPNDRLADVVKKITPRKDAPDFFILFTDGAIQMASGLCVTNAAGVSFAVEFVFRSDETLEKMSVVIDTPEN